MTPPLSEAQRADLLALAERCEAASGADRELDGRICVLTGWTVPVKVGSCGPSFAGRRDYEWIDPAGDAQGFQPPRYTASLDTAMTLVPDRCRFEVTTTGYKPGASVTWYDPTANAEGAYAATPALALTAASLRARATQGQTHD